MATTPYFATLSFPIGDRLDDADRESVGPMLRAAMDHPTRSAVILELLGSDGGVNCVLVSLAAASDSLPTAMRCWYGFSSDIEECDKYRRNGFPMMEALIKGVPPGPITVTCVYYQENPAISGAKWAPFLKLEHVPPWGAGGKYKATVTYEQHLQAPRPGQSDTKVCDADRNLISERLYEAAGTSDTATAHVMPVAACYPDFGELIHGLHAEGQWCGTLKEAAAPKHPRPSAGASADSRKAAAPAPQQVKVVDRDEVFGLPSFQFDDVKIIGFRIDLPRDDLRVATALSKLVAPLNFHRPPSPAADAALNYFEYQVTTHSVVIELLRYGRMLCSDPTGPLRRTDYLCQHELVVRLLVGRVDEGSSQARDPAVFVPTLFVDNPWSKAIGIQQQGYPKRLACFCAPGAKRNSVCLGMDGTRPGDGAAVALDRVTSIYVPTTINQAGWASARVVDVDKMLGKGQKLLGIAYAADRSLDRGEPGLPQDFREIDLSLLSDGAVRTPWRQSDFRPTQYSRSFAREVMRSRFEKFRSIQVTPLDDLSGLLPQAWINGDFTLEQAKFGTTPGLATLTFGQPERCPEWNQLVDLLHVTGLISKDDGTLSVLPGDWYRVECNIRLQLDNGLAWPATARN